MATSLAHQVWGGVNTLPMTDEQRRALAANIENQGGDVGRLSGLVASAAAVTPIGGATKIALQLTIAGLVAIMLEQSITHNPEKLFTDSYVDLVLKPFSERNSALSPLINEMAEIIKSSDLAKQAQNQLRK